jgi:hypothetical protein
MCIWYDGNLEKHDCWTSKTATLYDSACGTDHVGQCDLSNRFSSRIHFFHICVGFWSSLGDLSHRSSCQGKFVEAQELQKLFSGSSWKVTINANQKPPNNGGFLLHYFQVLLRFLEPLFNNFPINICKKIFDILFFTGRLIVGDVGMLPHI